MIVVENLEKYFSKNYILKNISCKIKKGEKIFIIGPSGSGKSTFLRCLNLLETPSSGKIYFEGIEITNSKTNINLIRQNINMVFQNFNLYENLNILKNITLAPIKLKKINKKDAEKTAIKLLERIGLKEKALSFPNQLSGGQKQRIAIARSVAMNPKVILLDEPTSSLDPEMVKEVLNVMSELSNSGLTMICVTHELNFAKKIADRIFFFNDGKIEESGSSVAIFNQPKSNRLKTFLSRTLKN